MEFQIYYEVDTKEMSLSRQGHGKGFRPLHMGVFSEEFQEIIIKEIKKVLEEGADSESGFN